MYFKTKPRSLEFSFWRTFEKLPLEFSPYKILKFRFFRFWSRGGGVNFKIERNSFSKYVLDLLVEQFAHYCEARFSFFKITTPPTRGLGNWTGWSSTVFFPNPAYPSLYETSCCECYYRNWKDMLKLRDCLWLTSLCSMLIVVKRLVKDNCFHIC